MIGYFCPEGPEPTGGIKQIYRHVDILNDADFDAAVLHTHKGFRVGWFTNDTRIEYLEEFPVRANDWIALPEVCCLDIPFVFQPAKWVLYVQNAYYTFFQYPMDKSSVPTPYLDERVKAIITNSEDGKKYLEYAFGKPVRIIPIGIPEAFSFQAVKENKLSFMPRKNPDDVRQVINILKHRGLLDGWELQPIDGFSEVEVARLMKESAVFMSFGAPEGLGLPPLEAMACGCAIIGYHGQGAKEYMLKRFPSISPVEVGEIVKFASSVEAAIHGFDKKGSEYLSRVRREASMFARTRYSMQQERRHVIAFWTELISA